MNERKVAKIGGCFVITIVPILIAIVALCICNNTTIEFKNPKTIICRERIKDSDTLEIWKSVKYEFANISYDTIRKNRRQRSTLEPEILAPKAKFIPTDKIDLNDYLGNSNDNTDWNFTEIDSQTMKYLDSLGIYWDEKRGYYKKKQNKY